MKSITITMTLDTDTGAVNVKYPNDPILALGIIERAKAVIFSRLDKPKGDAPKIDSGIEVAHHLPPFRR